MNFPPHLAFTLRHNEHKNYYETVQQLLKDRHKDEAALESRFVDKGQMMASMMTDELWELTLHTDRSNQVVRYAADLDALGLGSLTFPPHLSLSLEHNPHKVSSYRGPSDDYAEIHWDTISTYLDTPDIMDWMEYGQLCKSLDTDEFWTIQVYPRTPIGSYIYYAADLEHLTYYLEND